MDTRMKFLEHELAEQEREMIIRHETSVDSASSPVKSENTDILERKIRELEAIVKGLTEEMLDLKSVTRKLAMQLEGMHDDQPRNRAESNFFQKKSEFALDTKFHAQDVSQRQTSARAIPGRHPVRDIEDGLVYTTPRAVPATPMRAGTPHHTISSPTPEPEVPVEQLKVGEFEYVMQSDGTIQKRKKTTDHSVIIAGTGYNPGRTSHSMAIRTDSDAVIEVDEDDVITDDSKKHH
jgi:hypothetical protein